MKTKRVGNTQPGRMFVSGELVNVQFNQAKGSEQGLPLSVDVNQNTNQGSVGAYITLFQTSNPA